MAQMQEYGIIEKPKAAAPEPVKAPEVQAPIAKAQIKSEETNLEW
jgi:hypothetical protein